MSQLCLSCGLCCTDLLFASAPVTEEEVPRLVTLLGVQPERRGDKLAFPFPCPAHRDGCCTIYEDRPQVCRRYRCELLKNVEAGFISTEAAQDVVATTVGLLRRVDKHLPIVSNHEGPSPRLRALAERLEASDPSTPGTRTLAFDVALLGEMMTRYFLPPSISDTNEEAQGERFFRSRSYAGTTTTAGSDSETTSIQSSPVKMA